jgi:uncharacterized protein VirK/YbjX
MRERLDASGTLVANHCPNVERAVSRVKDLYKFSYDEIWASWMHECRRERVKHLPRADCFYAPS